MSRFILNRKRRAKCSENSKRSPWSFNGRQKKSIKLEAIDIPYYGSPGGNYGRLDSERKMRGMRTALEIQKFGGRHTEGLGDFFEGRKPCVGGIPAFKALDVLIGQVGTFGELLLGDAVLLPELTQPFGEPVPVGISHRIELSEIRPLFDTSLLTPFLEGGTIRTVNLDDLERIGRLKDELRAAVRNRLVFAKTCLGVARERRLTEDESFRAAGDIDAALALLSAGLDDLLRKEVKDNG